MKNTLNCITEYAEETKESTFKQVFNSTSIEAIGVSIADLRKALSAIDPDERFVILRLRH